MARLKFGGLSSDRLVLGFSLSLTANHGAWQPITCYASLEVFRRLPLETLMALREYRQRRHFTRSPEPPGSEKGPGRLFVVQQHWARREHFDFRLELDGVLKSWAVPKGPSLDPKERRLAVQVEDHPLEYAEFEGVIPPHEYGAGTVLVWDTGIWIPEGDPRRGYAKGHLKFRLEGQRLRGRWNLVRSRRGEEGTKENWLLIKSADEYATGEDLAQIPAESVLSGRTREEISAAPEHLWTEEGKQTLTSGPPMPREIVPQLATLVDETPTGPNWLYEIKFDGYRMLCQVRRGEVRLISRNGKDWTDRFTDIAQAFHALPLREGWFDGEIVVLLPDGTSNFQALQNAVEGRGEWPPVYFLFDLLFLDGEDLRRLPLAERKARLKTLLAKAGPTTGQLLRYTDHVEAEGEVFFQLACQQRLEGILAKRGDFPHRPGRSRDWLKRKCLLRQEFVVGGYTEPKGSRFGFGALLLGLYEDGQLHYVGRAGTGFTEQTLRSLTARLRKLKRYRSPFVNPPKGRGCHWVRPELVAEVAFSNWTEDGLLRQPTFQGLREDKPAREVVREKPTPVRAGAPAISPGMAPGKGRRTFAGVALSHPDKLLYPDQGVTKRDLAAYYETVAEWIVPEVANRPLTLLRCPEGHHDCFFQKHANETVPREVRRITIAEKGIDRTYMMVDDLAGIIALVQMGVLEIHVWGSRAQDLEHPDRMIFDLDPAEGLPWIRLGEAALHLRQELENLNLVPYLRTTGRKGLHVVVPLAAKQDWKAVKSFSKAVAERMAQLRPDLFTARIAKAARLNKVYVDYVRNSRGATAIASYSTRAQPGAPVAAPLFWEELAAEEHPRFTVQSLPARLSEQKESPWQEIERSAREITTMPKRSYRWRTG